MSDLTPEINAYATEEVVQQIQENDVMAELIYRYATDRAAFLFDFDKTLHRDQDGVHIGWKEQNEPLQDLLKDLSEVTNGSVAGISGRPEAFFISRLPKLFEFNMPLGVEFGALILQGDNSEIVLKEDISRKVMSKVQGLIQECLVEVNDEFGTNGQVPISIEGHKKTCRTILYDGVDHDGITQNARESLANRLNEKVAEFNESGEGGAIKFRVQNSKQIDILPVFPGEENIPDEDRDNGKHAATQYIVENVEGFSGVQSGEKKLYSWGDSSGDLPMFKAVKEYGGDNILVTDGFPEDRMDLVSAHNGEYENNLSLLKFLVDTPKHELVALVENNNLKVVQQLASNNGASTSQLALNVS